MKFMLMICGEEERYREREAASDMTVGCGGWTEEMRRRGVLVGGEGLRPPAEATTVRVRGDEVLLSDGPFAETKDQVGGFTVIDVADFDEAIEVAAAHPAAGVGMIEVRPIL